MEAEIRHRIRPTYGKDKVEIVTDEDCEIVIENGKCFVVRKQSKYPNTHEECCKVLGINSINNDNKGYRWELLCGLQELFICRDAYWKIAGEQMGLGKHWEYDMSKDEFSPAISYQYGYIQKCEIRHQNKILIFPTKEMRDAFYENFKELMESVKELL
jgi:hypothetical protein